MFDGRSLEEQDVCALPLVRRVAALLDGDPGEVREGDALPRGWHFLLFTPLTPQSGLRADGMPPFDGDVTPPGEFRIMLGGRDIVFDGDIPIGAPVRRRRTVLSADRKQGRSGLLVIVRRLHEIFVAGSATPVVREEEDMVLRGPSDRPAPAVRPPEPRAAEVTAPYRPTEAELFRYSAVTYNPHRIHYDAPYARDVEGYPGVVVNGGLTALMLLEMFRREAGREAARMRTRNVRPLFCGEPATLNAARTEDGWSLWAADKDGLPAVELEVR